MCLYAPVKEMNVTINRNIQIRTFTKYVLSNTEKVGLKTKTETKMILASRGSQV